VGIVLWVIAIILYIIFVVVLVNSGTTLPR